MYLLIHKNLVICYYVSLPVRLGRVNRKWYWQKKWFMVGIKKGGGRRAERAFYFSNVF